MGDMTDSDAEPRTFTVDYEGHPVLFTEIVGTGWRYRCPNACCKSWHWIDTESGTRHKITSAPGAPVTIVGSLWCPCERGGQRCTWHVHVTNGLAKNA